MKNDEPQNGQMACAPVERRVRDEIGLNILNANKNIMAIKVQRLNSERTHEKVMALNDIIALESVYLALTLPHAKLELERPALKLTLLYLSALRHLFLNIFLSHLCNEKFVGLYQRLTCYVQRIFYKAFVFLLLHSWFKYPIPNAELTRTPPNKL